MKLLSYARFRLEIYHNALALWLENIKQTSLAIVALFPFALTALVFIPFIFIGLILKPSTADVSFLNTLWGYLLLLYTVVNLQKDGLLGRRYQHYLTSLPISKLRRLLVDIGMTVYVAHFFVLAPLLLFLYALFNLPSQSNELVSALVPLVGLLGLSIYYCYAAVKRPLPWLSLLCYPLFMGLSGIPLNKFEYLSLWLLLIVLEPWLPKLKSPFSAGGQNWYTLFVQWDKSQPQSNKITFVVSLLLLAVTKIIVDATSAEVGLYFVNFACFLYGVITAANLFHNTKLLQQYQAYFTSLPVSHNKLLGRAVIYTSAKAGVIFVLLLLSQTMGWQQWLLLLGFYATSVLGVLLWPTRFLIPPMVLASVLVLASIFV